MLKELYLGNTLQAWLTAVVVAALVLVFLLTIRRLIWRHLKHISSRTSTWVDDLVVEVLGKTKYSFLGVVGLYAGSLNLTLPDMAEYVLKVLLHLSVLLQVGCWASAAATHIVRLKGAEDAGQSSRTAILFAVKLVLWSVIVLLALDNLGVDVTALVTGLGIGGVAVALALQNVLGDLFASMSITLDKPFVPGDFIAVDSLVGTVETIGLKTTRVKSLSGEQLIFANADLLNSRIRNFGRMRERRIVFSVGVTYQTPHATLERIPAILAEIIAQRDGTRFDRAHFQKFGDSALVFEVVYFVTDPDYNRYMDLQQAINLEICRRFAAEGVDFAYPTQTVYVQSALQGPSYAA